MLAKWLGSLGRLNLSRRPRRPKAGKSIAKRAYLDIELLEKKELFSSSPWLLRPPFAAHGAGFDGDPWFAALGPVLLPLNGAGGGLSLNSYHSTGSFTADFAGNYTFTLHILGTLAATGGPGGPPPALMTMTFDETGTVAFDYGSTGTVGDGAFSAGFLSGPATAVVSWHYTENGLSRSGNGTYNYTEDAEDPYHW